METNIYTNGEELLSDSKGSFSDCLFKNFVISNTTAGIVKKQFFNCTFTNVIFDKCTFYEIDFMNCSFNNVHFRGCGLASCTFERTTIFLTDFYNCSFGGSYSHGRNIARVPVSFVDNTIFMGYSGFYHCTFLKGSIFENCRIGYGDAELFVQDCTFHSHCVEEHTADFLEPFITQHCPSHGGFIGWKVVEGCIRERGSQELFEGHGPLIAKIYIPADAKRVNGPGAERKCRCSRAKVLEYYRPSDMKPICPDYVSSIYDKSFIYPGIGEYIKPDSFDDSVFMECSNGIHFFLTLQEALVYSKHF